MARHELLGTQRGELTREGQHVQPLDSHRQESRALLGERGERGREAEPCRSEHQVRMRVEAHHHAAAAAGARLGQRLIQDLDVPQMEAIEDADRHHRGALSGIVRARRARAHSPGGTASAAPGGTSDRPPARTAHGNTTRGHATASRGST